MKQLYFVLLFILLLGKIIFAQDTIPPAFITNLLAQPGSSVNHEGEIQLSWSSPGDDGWTGQLTTGSKFRIQYTSTLPVIWSTANAQIVISAEGYNPAQTVIYSITGLINGVTYYFRVWTNDDVGNYSEISNATTTWAQTDTYPPATINSLVADRLRCNEGEIRLVWTTPGDNWNYGNIVNGTYWIKYTVSPTDTFETAPYSIIFNNINISPFNTDSRKINGLISGTTYFFWIKTKDETPSNWSSESNKAFAWAQTDVTAPKQITNLNATWGPKNGEIILNWTAPGDDGSIGTAVSYTIKYSTNSYPQEYSDNFENEDITGWQTGGSANWIIDTNESHAGFVSAKSGPIGDNQFTYIKKTVTGPFKLSWWWKVSSELNQDVLEFYFDNIPIYSISGEVNWKQDFYDIPAGIHTIEWRYTKDINGSSGSDAGWIDDISPGADDWWNNATIWKTDRPVGGSSGYNETETINGLNSSTKYYFSIITKDEKNNWSDYSNLATIVTKEDTVSPGPVTNLVAITGPSDYEITLNWTSPGDNGQEGILPYGSKYKIQYSENYLESWNINNAQITISTSNVAPGSSQTYIITGLKGLTTYYFRLWTLDESQNQSPISNGATTWAQTYIPPAPVTDLYATQGIYETEVKLSWISPGDDGKTGILKPNSKFKIQYSLSGNELWNIDNSQITISTYNISPGSLQTYIITGLTPTLTYYFRLWTLDEYNNCSSISNGATTWAQIDSIPPNPVTDLTADRIDCVEGQIRLTWTTPGDNGSVGVLLPGSKFKIQYSSWTGVTWSIYSTQKTILLSDPANPGEKKMTYIFGLNPKVTYYFCLWTSDEGDRWSSESNKPSTWAQIDVNPPGRITTLIATPGNSEGKINLNWIAPGDNGYSGRANFYEIRYSTAYLTTEQVNDFEEGNLGTWQTGGNKNWFIDNTGHNSNYSARSGKISDGEYSWIGITVTGPMLLSWWWKVSSEKDYDKLCFYIDRNSNEPPYSDDPRVIYSISGETNWEQKEYYVSEGTHTIEWCYVKDHDISKGEDSGWIDDIPAGVVNWWNNATVWKNNLPVSGDFGTQESETITGLISGTTYYICIKTCDELYNWSMYSNTGKTYAQVDVTPPGAISDLVASVSPNEGEVVLQWTAPGDDGEKGTVSGYEIRVSSYDTVTSAGWTDAQYIKNYWTSFLPSGSTETRAISGLNYGTTYWFAIKAYDEMFNYGIWNSSKDYSGINTQCKAFVFCIPPAPVTDLYGITGDTDNSVLLTWTATGNNGLVGSISHGLYCVKYTTNSAQTWENIENSIIWQMENTYPGKNETKIIDGLSSGLTYYFYLKISDEGNEYNFSSVSNRTTAWAQYSIPPDAITDLSASPGKLAGEIDLTWTSPGDDGSVGDIIDGKYWIKYSSYSTDTWDTMPQEIIWVMSTTPKTITKKTIQGLESGKTYYFYIKTQDEINNNWSQISNKASGIAQNDLGPPATINNLSATTGSTEGQIVLNWNAPGDDGLEGTIVTGMYWIKYSRYATATWDTAESSFTYTISNVAPNTPQERLIGGLIGGVTYYFWIRTQDEIPGNWSGISNRASNWAQVDVTPPATINNLSADRECTEGQIRLTWTSPGDDEMSNNIINGLYYVKYTSNPADTWDTAPGSIQWPVSTIPNTPQSYIVGGLEPKTTYYFWIKTRDETPNNWSGTSNRASTWAQIDVTPPGIINSLSATKTTVEGEIILTWTTTGDDGNTGNITTGKYWIKYSSIATTSWDTMGYEIILSTNDIIPGRNETYTFSKLNPDTTYYFLIKLADEMTNWSSESNKANAYPLDIPPNPPTGLRAVGADKKITLIWNRNTEYDIDYYRIYCDSTPPEDNYFLVGTTNSIMFVHTGLTNSITYWYKITAVDTPPIPRESDFSISISTKPIPPPPPKPQNFIGIALSSTSIKWSWIDVDTEEGYLICNENNVAVSDVLPINSNTFIEENLSPNTQYTRYVRAFNLGGYTNSDSTTKSTLPNKPYNLKCLGKTVSSINLSWTPGEGGAFCYGIERSTDGINYSFIVEWIDTYRVNNFIDGVLTPPLLEYTTYWYRVIAYNSDGDASEFSEPFAVRTSGDLTEPVRNLIAKPIEGKKIELTWIKSISPNVKEYRIYFSSSNIDYKTPQAIVSSYTQTWVSNPLEDNTLYKFVIRGVNTKNYEEENSNEIACESMQTLNRTKSIISLITNGQHISGNRVTLSAELISGNNINIKSISFKYRQTGTDIWNEIGTPDTEYPFIVYWNTDELLDNTKYQLCCVVTDINNNVDLLPSYITVTIDKMEPEIEEKIVNQELIKKQKIYNDSDNIIYAGHNISDKLTKLILPKNSLNVEIASVTIVVNPNNIYGHQKELAPVDEYREIILSNGQTYLNNNIMATISIPYTDNDNNGFIDNKTGIRVSNIRVYRYNKLVNLWEKEPSSNSSPDIVNKICTITTNELSLFGLFASVSYDLSSVHVYPNPFKPNSGLNHTNINFIDIPDWVRIRILNLAGDVVFDKEISATGGSYAWDAKNNNGEDLASGIYIYYIISKQDNKKGKLAIIR